MDVGRFIGFIRIKVKTKPANPQDCWHGALFDLHNRQFHEPGAFPLHSTGLPLQVNPADQHGDTL
jgi:hypothetical protein